MAIWLVMLKDKIIDRFPLAEGDAITIGRSKSADLVIDNDSVSRSHVRFALKDGKYELEDLGSRNGTYVNGSKIEGSVLVTSSDVIQIGKFMLTTSRNPDDVAPFALYAKKGDSVKPRAATADELMPETIYAEMDPDKLGSYRQLTVLKGKAEPKRLPLGGKEEFVISKEAGSDITISGWLVGNVTCFIVVGGKNYYLKPHPGASAPMLNGKKVIATERLGVGDVIKVGGAELKFESGA